MQTHLDNSIKSSAPPLAVQVHIPNDLKPAAKEKHGSGPKDLTSTSLSSSSSSNDNIEVEAPANVEREVEQHTYDQMFAILPCFKPIDHWTRDEDSGHVIDIFHSSQEL